MPSIDDFELECTLTSDDNEFDYNCELSAVSDQAIVQYGLKPIGHISASFDSIVIKELQRQHGSKKIPNSTIILDYIGRSHRNIELVGIGMNILCTFIANLTKTQKLTHVYLQAVSTPDGLPKLMALYHRFGFVSVSGNYPDCMVVKITKLKQLCKNKLLKKHHFNMKTKSPSK